MRSDRQDHQEFRVFYAWQSDLPNKTNRGLIKDALEKAIKLLNESHSIEVADRNSGSAPSAEYHLDHDTKNVPGSPDLAGTIFDKIKTADLFIADVSFTGKSNDQRKLQPNSNVLVELGYALGVLGPDKVLMILNTSTGNSDQLPFDIRHKRHITYSVSEHQAEIATERQALTRVFVESIKFHSKDKQRHNEQTSIEIEIQMTFGKEQIRPRIPHWGFRTEIYATNRTTTTIQDYELFALVPRGLFSQGSKDFEKPIKNTSTHIAFAYPRANQTPTRLLPGKKELLMSHNCLLYSHNLGKMNETLQQSIHIELFAHNLDVQRCDAAIIEYNPFRLLKVDEDHLEFAIPYNVKDFPNVQPTSSDVVTCECC